MYNKAVNEIMCHDKLYKIISVYPLKSITTSGVTPWHIIHYAGNNNLLSPEDHPIVYALLWELYTRQYSSCIPRIYSYV